MIKLFLVLAMAVLVSGEAIAQEYDERAKVESRREGSLITLLFENAPEQDRYFIIENGVSVGTVTVISVEKSSGTPGKVRVYARYALDDTRYDYLVRAGLSIGLRKQKEKKERDYSEKKYMEVLQYRKRIITPSDGREMLLIPRGKFLFGSNSWEKTESPETVSELGDFYIDKYEVSNRDYYRYITESGSPPPGTWPPGGLDGVIDDLPAIVSYHEAASYARWAKKRLPTEMEWEKAARGQGFTYVVKDDKVVVMDKKPLAYPWGTLFHPDRCNSLDFWQDASSGKAIKEKYTRGYLPVAIFEGEGDSPYGVVNMAGNAAEWTSDWYGPYEESRYKDARFGTLLKVLRGGSWMNTGSELRATRRALGGIPNLYRDRIGGIRCVKLPTVLDRVSDVNQDNKNK